ncbi:hypothetical protein TCAL_05141 [Tigriopus californicus]|uniref:Band 7 domain-containing protein n=1 Tax=Tigriopus californicus TaxID=6832 RepID=A0A553NE82_TIGCA|nr:band 7 protein AGAP004871-like isoform X1 [Tigriopus californicus]XP_059093175.1 band 7 protein AGAP004871-like isoform X1 [Tigriopus californicus]TRY63756.1 hypothetical protein TCAL_05141 [Tigriopus californicus]
MHGMEHEFHGPVVSVDDDDFGRDTNAVPAGPLMLRIPKGGGSGGHNDTVRFAGDDKATNVLPPRKPTHQIVSGQGDEHHFITTPSGQILHAHQDKNRINKHKFSHLMNEYMGACMEDNCNIADPEGPGVCAMLLTFLAFILVLVTMPFSLCVTVKVVQEYERAVVFRLGRLRAGGAKGPGLFFIMPCVDSYKKVDLRTVSFDVPPQEVLSRDSVTVSVDAVVYYRVSNPTMATNNIEDYSHSTRLLAATTLRNVLGTKNLAEILSERETISQVMQNALDEATDPWGVKAERVEIKDVRLPVQLQRAMAAEAEAAREARAKVIAAEGEQKASRALREAASVIAESPSALQLRYLQTLNSIAAEHNSTIIFPMPMNIMDHFMGKRAIEPSSPPPRKGPPTEILDSPVL